MAASIDPFRTGKAYTAAQAAGFADTSAATVRRWIAGYEHEGRRMEPVFGEMRPADGEPFLLSFLELAEVIVAARFTKWGGKLQKVRDARAFARQRWPELAYPFASLRLKKLGGELLHEFDEDYGGKALAISLGGSGGEQWTLPGMVDQALDLFEFDENDELANRWFPAGKDVPVVVDPHFAGGRLTVVGRGVTVKTVCRRFFTAKQPIAFIAHDLDLRRRDVEAIIQFSDSAA
jgi:uncharacterized protein (DUF433 family)